MPYLKHWEWNNKKNWVELATKVCYSKGKLNMSIQVSEQSKEG